MGTKCKTGKDRQGLSDALKKMRADGCALLDREGYRLKLAPLHPDGPAVGEALVRNGNKVEQVTLTEKDTGWRTRVTDNGRFMSPRDVLAKIEARRAIPGVTPKVKMYEFGQLE